ncbi:lytic transglycosylase domain-containing protein [Rhizobium pusense]|jgi:soluble lytic murein transglycosylase-like protein|nr:MULTISPECIES: lytic transglycosylase domain-containing protein [Hyphomicrobiales]EGP54470.1 lytic transglycosylase, catalytic [Agrobacterium tumefaciens F2]KAB2756180.1 lytic transglycosylase domain-containing protein [Brucella anthropi]KAB2794724.1 lytic transglycosylase domain-containing protein [Brucella anthropi]KRA68972.1 lytic transglycosylase [Rhizobium sp. Root651]MBR7653621.1 lytic transglycosylase domain-containing protein [Brucella oryzae]
MVPVQPSASVGPPSAARRPALLLLLSGLIFAAPSAFPAYAQTVQPARNAAADPHAAHVAEASRRFAIPQAWIVAVKRAESAGDMRAVSPAGAMGLMQIMPATWAELRGRYGLGRDPFAPRDNILAGTAYLREMLDRYGNVAAMLAAYNAGPARLDQHLATGRALPAETRAYVAAILPAIGVKADLRAAAMLRGKRRGWRDAPLFVGAPGDAAASLPARRQPAVAPQSGDLFIARSGAGGPR